VVIIILAIMTVIVVQCSVIMKQRFGICLLLYLAVTSSNMYYNMDTTKQTVGICMRKGR